MGFKKVSNFSRGLDKEFVDALNEEYRKNGWWKRLVDDPDLFIAIRANSINVYFRGCSLLKLSWNNGEISGTTHYKYLLHPRFEEQYVKVISGELDLQSDLRNMFIENLEDVDSLKLAANIYAGGEKTGVHNIVLANHNVLDVEIAFGSSKTDEDSASAPRIDISALQGSSREARIVFFEAKQFSNGDLRAQSSRTPDVIDQIETYRNLLSENKNLIVESYRRICGNLCSLTGIEYRYRKHIAIIEGVSNRSIDLDVDTDPVLLVFGFDEDQRTGRIWKSHRERLEQLLNKGQKKKLFLRGNSRNFTRGISK